MLQIPLKCTKCGTISEYLVNTTPPIDAIQCPSCGAINEQLLTDSIDIILTRLELLEEHIRETNRLVRSLYRRE